MDILNDGFNNDASVDKSAGNNDAGVDMSAGNNDADVDKSAGNNESVEDMSQIIDGLLGDDVSASELRPAWVDEKGKVDEVLLLEAYIKKHDLAFMGEEFRDVNGFVPKGAIGRELYEMIAPYCKKGINTTVRNVIAAMKWKKRLAEMEINEDLIQFSNGTLNLTDFSFSTVREIRRNTLPVAYNPDAPVPETWLRFLNELLYESDIPSLQEFLGQLPVPTTRGQALYMLIGRGGEGKSVLKTVLLNLLGDNMTMSRFQKLENDKYAVATLRGKLLMLDEEMDLDALSKTNTIKMLTTLRGNTETEEKNKQSIQMPIYARLMGLGNGPLHALHDDSDGFFRRQLIVKVRNKRTNRIDDAYLGDKLAAESEGILLWCLEGLKRLRENGWKYTISERMLKNRQEIREADNNIIGFLNSTGYTEYDRDAFALSEYLHKTYLLWCKENAEKPVSMKVFSSYLHKNQDVYHIKYDHNIKVRVNEKERSKRGYYGIRIIAEEIAGTAYQQQDDGEEKKE